jgi:Fe-S-cluster-containing hydrogenase component 2
MKRKIINIDEELCDGCGLCIPSCHEGAIQLVDTPAGKKARLVKEIYCDGLGDCLGACPTGALTIEEREAEAYSEAAVRERLGRTERVEPLPTGCPGSRVMRFDGVGTAAGAAAEADIPSELRQWPIQLHLLPTLAPFFQEADLVFLADCCAAAVPALHRDLLRGRAIAMACPKLDDTSTYVQKISDIIRLNQPKSLTVAYMQVPCCTAMVYLVQQARDLAGSRLPITAIQYSLQGQKLFERVEEMAGK